MKDISTLINQSRFQGEKLLRIFSYKLVKYLVVLEQ